MENEVWKVAHVTSKSVWEVSDQGRVKCNGELWDYNHCNGYAKLSFGLLHRKIAELFIPNPYNKPEVDHINGIKTDNRAVNLRWVTDKENMNNPVTKNKLIDIMKQYYCDHPMPLEERIKHGRKKEQHGRWKTRQMYKNGEYISVKCEEVQSYMNNGWICKGRGWSKKQK